MMISPAWIWVVVDCGSMVVEHVSLINIYSSRGINHIFGGENLTGG
jgi:hypothetical protein